jgi:hypothetical protein
MRRRSNTTQHNTTQHNTTQHNTTQHNTTQHNTINIYLKSRVTLSKAKASVINRGLIKYNKYKPQTLKIMVNRGVPRPTGVCTHVSPL